VKNSYSLSINYVREVHNEILCMSNSIESLAEHATNNLGLVEKNITGVVLKYFVHPDDVDDFYRARPGTEYYVIEPSSITII